MEDALMNADRRTEVKQNDFYSDHDNAHKKRM